MPCPEIQALCHLLQQSSSLSGQTGLFWYMWYSRDVRSSPGAASAPGPPLPSQRSNKAAATGPHPRSPAPPVASLIDLKADYFDTVEYPSLDATVLEY